MVQINCSAQTNKSKRRVIAICVAAFLANLACKRQEYLVEFVVPNGFTGVITVHFSDNFKDNYQHSDHVWILRPDSQGQITLNLSHLMTTERGSFGERRVTARFESGTPIPWSDPMAKQRLAITWWGSDHDSESKIFLKVGDYKQLSQNP